MSISDALREAIGSGKLCVLEPEFESDPLSRTMLLHPEIARDLDRALEIPRIGRLKADLENFILGHEITLCLTPRAHKSAYMGLLEPCNKGTWDIRSRDPSPGIRVFGSFADKDVFVALHWMPRSRQISGFSKKPLKDNETQWQLSMMESENRWKIALPNLSPLIGVDASDYVSEKYYCFSD